MANVFGQVAGGQPKNLEASTVAQVKELMNAKNYTASINGDPAEDSEELADFDVITLSPSVKGA